MTTDITTEQQAPTDEEVAQASAYLAGIAYGFGILIGEWTGQGNGTATTEDEEGTRLVFTGDEVHPFDAIIPCARHGRHRVGVTYAHQLDQARNDTAECSAEAPTPAPAARLRAVPKPTPLWLITSVADTPGRDHHKSAS
ncbi:hypothetical protein EDD90_2833 [Streptomyces sp. Ag109_O5-1]|uniref:hypothetical protein n=1 Tax=Streptomyces sp. Ag109_O5-1 TaxID=1938851 RepID=UPI000F4E63B4|nr:hypothetical protein [Streptomyces sp. Ag109_O5-1]RPE39815.1 hypothetical protein EDD90_2833 [Streptomyces sp. Ag109_O5-1]